MYMIQVNHHIKTINVISILIRLRVESVKSAQSWPAQMTNVSYCMVCAYVRVIIHGLWRVDYLPYIRTTLLHQYACALCALWDILCRIFEYHSKVLCSCRWCFSVLSVRLYEPFGNPFHVDALLYDPPFSLFHHSVLIWLECSPW